MPKTVHKTKKANQQKKRKSRAEIIVEHNLRVALARERELKAFPAELRGGAGSLDSSVRSVSIKFTQLPFGFISESCGGHFSKSKIPHAKNQISPAKIKPGEEVYFSGGWFEMRLDFSQGAMKFKAALKGLTKKHPFVKFNALRA